MRLVCGMQPVREAIRARGPELEKILIAKGEGADGPQLDALSRFAVDHGVLVERTTRAELDRLTKGAKHQGALAWAPELTVVPLDELTMGPRGLLIALDELQDPQNFGAIVRSAVALGRAAVMWPEHRSAPLSAAMFRASAGAVEHARLCRVPSLTAALTEAVANGVQVVGLDPQADRALRELDLKQPTLLVLGSEGEGMGRSVRRSLSTTARLAQSGRIGSLNASVAAAIALYEASNQRVTT